MAHRFERLIPRDVGRRGWLLAAALGVTLLAWLLVRGPGDGDNPATEQSLVVERRPFTASIGFMGTIVAGDGISVTAPFDGTVKRLGFAYGDRVLPGQMLMEVDVAELEQSRNDAESAFLKASQTAADMDEWKSGPEVSRARRAATSASLDLQDTERKLAETRELLDRGLVPRAEYDGLLQQRRAQQMAAISAAEELGTTLARGDGADRRVAMLELANARARLARLNAQFSGSVIRARDAGIIVRPPTGAQYAEQKDINIGSAVAKGQLIGLIARAGGLGASFSLDEGDVNLVRPGQVITITGPGFPGLSLTGRISSIAGEATPVGSAGTGKGFVAMARLDPLTPEQALQVRIGMSASIAVATYTNPAAIVVPPQAVRGAAPEATVMARNKAGDDARPVIVQIGRIAPDGVEILSGLKPGNIVVWTTTLPAPAP